MGGSEKSIGSPKSVADVLVEELEGEIGDACTHEASVEGKQERLREAVERIHREDPNRSALCLSGGGIRSASFGLGILQGLARKGVLGKFDYLSTVSGGGYVGGWLSAWMHHEAESVCSEPEREEAGEKEDDCEERGRQQVIEQLGSRPGQYLNPEPEPVRHLRAYSNYLTPRLGVFSADAWTLIATFLRNMLLNWLVLLSWCAALLMLPRFFVMAVFIQPSDFWLYTLLGGATAMIGCAMAYALVDTPCAGNARWPQRNFVAFRQVPLFLAALLLVTCWAGYSNTHAEAKYLREPGAIRLFAAFLMTVYLIGGAIGESMIASRQRAKAQATGGTDRSAEKSGFTDGRDSSGWRILAAIGRLFSIVVVSGTGGVLLWLIATRVFPSPAGMAFHYVCWAPALVMSVFLLVNFLFAGLASWFSEDEDREWWGRSAAWLLINIVGWTALASIALTGPVLLEKLFSEDWFKAYLGPLAGLFGGAAGLAGALLGFSSGTPAGTPHKSGGKGRQLLLAACALIFILFLSLAVSNAFAWRIRERLGSNAEEQQKGLQDLAGSLYRQVSPYDYPDKDNPKWQAWLESWKKQEAKRLLIVTALRDASVVFTGLLLVGIAAGFFINVNEFSLHCVYRNRLIRAFLGASRPKEKRNPHRFTGFDPKDNIAMSDLPRVKPLHVINIALNIVKGGQLAWQERKAESFTVSRLHCGGWHSGYRPAGKYGGGITLGTALTISGAAASSNMGYNSSPLVSFLMTLFNVRLGWWLGNPGEAGAHTWTKPGPVYSLGPLFAEAFGLTRLGYKYVNLSDGGHFDNLGLYEMVLRRCRHIVLVDAGCDTNYNFEDLGNALRKIRIDFGIQIDIQVASPLKEEEKVWYCAVGKIRYSEIDRLEDGSIDPKRDGQLIYIKPLLKGRAPADVRSYLAAHPEFPHESTADQWFSESQLESYRSLGVHMAESICGEKPCGSLDKFFAEVTRRSERGE